MGRLALSFFRYLGELAGLIGQVCESLLRGRKRWRQVFEQVAEIGYRSQLVVIITGAFTGAVLATQALFQFALVDMETMGGVIVSIGMLRELGPTITGLMLAGRVGSSMAAEIGTMKVTEQIDALRSMGVHPIDYLVTPRLLAMCISIPLLIAQSAAFGILASYWVGVHLFRVPGPYWNFNVERFTDGTDITIAMVKGFVFGLLIVIISCHQGLRARNGAVGVGRGTTDAMVFSALAILIFNLFLTLLMQLIFPVGISMT
ncbi:MAG: ABC transporter permease [Roseibacillus sp.]|nr:ABC transporter permease [Roseibacillus sp.]